MNCKILLGAWLLMNGALLECSLSESFPKFELYEPGIGIQELQHAIDTGNFEAFDNLGLSIFRIRGVQPVRYAIQKDKADSLQELIERGCSVEELPNDDDSDPTKPLHLAAACHALGCVQILFLNNADFNARRKNGFTPLMNAIDDLGDGGLEVVQKLIEYKADVTCITGYNKSPLRLAASKGAFNVIKALVAAGAPVNNQDNGGGTALSRTLENDYLWYYQAAQAINTVRTLIELKASAGLQNNEGTSALDLAVQNGREGAVKYFLVSGLYAQFRVPLSPYIISAAIKGHVNVVQVLVDAHCDINAAPAGNTALISLFTCSKYKEPLSVDLQKEQSLLVKQLLAMGADPKMAGSGGNTALHYAAQQGRRDAVSALIAGGAEILKQNNLGETAGTLASNNGKSLFLVT